MQFPGILSSTMWTMIEQEVYRGLKSKGLLSLPYGAVEGGGRIEVLSIPPLSGIILAIFQNTKNGRKKQETFS